MDAEDQRFECTSSVWALLFLGIAATTASFFFLRGTLLWLGAFTIGSAVGVSISRIRWAIETYEIRREP